MNVEFISSLLTIQIYLLKKLEKDELGMIEKNGQSD